MASSGTRSINIEAASGISSYQPISNLERQYAAPIGQRTHIFVKLNPNCCLPGGVEALLKQKEPLQVSSSSLEPSDAPNNKAAPAASADDPFSFLSSGASSSEAPPSGALPPQKAGAKMGKFFTKLAKTTQQNLEKGITNMVIKADQGKNPDILQLGLYDGSGTQLWSLTEPQSLPITDYERMKGVMFTIPVTVPPTPNNNNEPVVVTLKLWIKSGAPLLKQKHYLLGQAHVSLDALHQDKRLMSPRMLPLQSTSVVDGQLQLLVCRDLKFPQLYGRGWSLTDPDMSGYMSHFHYPLDQSYGFLKGNDWWVASERATESAIVLPLATCMAQLVQKAASVSMAHGTSRANQLLANRHDSPQPYKATVQATIGYLHLTDAKQTTAAQLSLHWQRPDSIFEIEILPNTRVPVHTVQVPFPTTTTPTAFYPKVATPDTFLPALLQLPSKPTFLLGNLRILISISSGKSLSVGDPFAAPGPGTHATTLADDETWHAIVPLESYIGQNNNNATTPIQVAVHHSVTGVAMGTVVLQLGVTMPASQAAPPPDVPATGGLPSLMGVDSLMETMGTLPALDFDAPTTAPTDPAMQRRHQQLKTMGNFVTHQYLSNHMATERTKDVDFFNARPALYQSSLRSTDPLPPSFKDKSPRAFRPSSSRLTEEVAGIPFNVHTVTLALEQAAAGGPGGLFHNITCGAPADHARGFGPVFLGGPSGGLRRLEARRLEWQAKLYNAQTALIGAVATFFVQARQANQTIYHIPARHQQIAGLRWNVFELTQQLHQITWTCTVRRANVFSQALAIALTTYLTDISDTTSQWPELWVKHGYLITYEGLLSAIGKELGMIEDASVGISMLRNVTVQLVSAELPPPAEEDKVDMAHSPHLKWIHVSASGVGSTAQYRVRMALDAQFFNTRLAPPLRSHAGVRFYPLLYQVGVDIRQAAAHTHSNVKQQLNQSVINTGGCNVDAVNGKSDDEEEDFNAAGQEDDDVLTSLNYEALRKMNTYAHLISPIAPAGSSVEAAQAPLQVHPILTSLHSHITGSSGKMNHGILDEAASVAQKLGGGGVVFCKSGKDRTAMHVTYKQAQYIHRYLVAGSTAPVTTQQSTLVYDDATKLRVYGTRLPICEKNVGQAKYAFNTLQVRFMPEMLKPPISTLAGFLKGGAVFKPGSGIES